MSLLFWLGGFWRLWLPAGLTGVWLALVLANSAAPGTASAAARRGAARALQQLPALMAGAVACAALALGAGAVTVGAVGRSLVFFALQLALHPFTPLLLLLLATAAGLLWLDTRQRSALALLTCWWPRLWPPVARRLGATAPAVLAAALAGAFAATLFPDAMRGWNRADGPDAHAYHLYRAFFNFSIYEDDRLERRSGFGLGLRGLTLPPGESGEIVFRLDRPATSIVHLRADFYNRRLAESGTALTEEKFPNRLELNTGGPGAPYEPLLEDASLGEIIGGRVLDLTAALGSARTYRLRFTARNTTAGEVTVLPAFSVSTAADPAALPHGAFPVVAYAALAAAAACALLRTRATPKPALALGAALGAALAVAAWLAARAAPAAEPTLQLGLRSLTFDPGNPPEVEFALRAARAIIASLAGGALVWSLTALVRRSAEASPSPPALLWVACALATVVALDARWQELMRIRYELLLPDAAGYQAIAAEFPIKMARYRSERPSELLEALYDSGFDGKASVAAVFYAGGNNGREPGWPALLRLVFNVLGVSAFHTRLTSLLIASGCAGFTCWLGWRTLHPLAGLTGGLLYAFNYPQIVNSVGGLREEAVALCFLTLIAALFCARRSPHPTTARLLIAGLASGCLILIRADMLVLAGLVITLAALALRWRPKHWLIACAICGLLAGPMYVGYAFTHRDPFYPGTYGATVNRNLEFPERMGTPGFPTVDEYAANWAAGPRISPMTYFFGYHSLPQFVQYSINGFIRIFPTILFRDQPAQLWLFVVGVALLLARRRWLIPFVVVISLAPFYAFMAGVPNPWVFAPRYAHHTLPFAVLAAAYALWFLPHWLYTRLAARDRPPRLRVSKLRTALS